VVGAAGSVGFDSAAGGRGVHRCEHVPDKDAIAATLRQVAALASGSTLAMSFMLPIELADPEVRPELSER